MAGRVTGGAAPISEGGKQAELYHHRAKAPGHRVRRKRNWPETEQIDGGQDGLLVVVQNVQLGGPRSFAGCSGGGPLIEIGERAASWRGRHNQIVELRVPALKFCVPPVWSAIFGTDTWRPRTDATWLPSTCSMDNRNPD